MSDKIEENGDEYENEEDEEEFDNTKEKMGKINIIEDNNEIINKENKKVFIDEEKELLAKKREEILDEKQRLINILDDIQDKLEEKRDKGIDEIYEEIIDNTEKKSKKLRIKNGFLLIIMFYIIGPIFSIFNLIGIFQTISIMKVIWIIFKNMIKFFFQYQFKEKTDEFNYDETINFNLILYNNSRNEIADFNLVMITGFIGSIIFKYTGFYITSIIFLIVNSAGIIMILSCEFIKNKDIFKNDKGEIVPDFSVPQILYIFGCFLILFIGCGGSALLSQYILNEGFSKLKTYMLKIQLERIQLNAYYIRKYYNENLKKNNEETNNYDDDEINNSNKKGDDNNGDNELSDDPQKLKDKFKIDENDKQFKEFIKKNQSKFDNYFIISFTTILGYFLKYLINIFLIKQGIEYNNFFYYIIGIYAGAIISSFCFCFLYDCSFKEEEENDEKKNKNEYSIYKIFGCTIYSQKIFKERNKPKCECIKLLCKSLKNCFDNTICAAFDELFKKYFKCNNCECCECCDCCNFCICCYIFGNCCCCDDNFDEQKLKCCCCDCCDLDNISYEQNHTYFCYCYQSQRTFKWFNNYISSEIQKKLSPYILEYFFLQFLTIAFEKQYEYNINENNKNNNFDGLFIYIILFFGNIIIFFYFTLSFSNYLDEENDAYDIAEKIQELSNNILHGLPGIIIVNGIYSIIFSPYNFFSEKFNELLNNNYFIYSPILLNKFFYFTFNYYCISLKDDKENNDLITGYLLISIYLSIQNLIISLIKDNISNDNILYLIQFIPSFIPSIIFCLFFLLLFIASIIQGKLPLFLFKLISFILCFGGLWSYNIEEENNCKCKYNCKEGYCKYNYCNVSDECQCCCKNCNSDCECGEGCHKFLKTILCLNCLKDDDNDSFDDLII